MDSGWGDGGTAVVSLMSLQNCWVSWGLFPCSWSCLARWWEDLDNPLRLLPFGYSVAVPLKELFSQHSRTPAASRGYQRCWWLLSERSWDTIWWLQCSLRENALHIPCLRSILTLQLTSAEELESLRNYPVVKNLSLCSPNACARSCLSDLTREAISFVNSWKIWEQHFLKIKFQHWQVAKHSK